MPIWYVCIHYICIYIYICVYVFYDMYSTSAVELTSAQSEFICVYYIKIDHIYIYIMICILPQQLSCCTSATPAQCICVYYIKIDNIYVMICIVPRQLSCCTRAPRARFHSRELSEFRASLLQESPRHPVVRTPISHQVHVSGQVTNSMFLLVIAVRWRKN